MPLKILCIHGLGDHRNGEWKGNWRAALEESLTGLSQNDYLIDYFSYDEIFDEVDISSLEVTETILKLLAGAVRSAWDDFWGTKSRGILSPGSDAKLKWTAGYVAGWLADDGFRRTVRLRLLDRLLQDRPDVILAHSLGTLISYDVLTSSEASAKPGFRQYLQGTTYIVMGSQLGNPFVKANLTPGRIAPLPVKQWFHLYNRNDRVLTASFAVPDDPNYVQVNTPFDDPESKVEHSAALYITNDNAKTAVWNPLARDYARPAQEESPSRGIIRLLQAKRPARRKALLIGINDYPDPAARLEGCVNDTYLMSSVLQESGFKPKDIRLCLNDRATAQGIRDRIEWLLDDFQPGDECVFYYSGHGAQMAGYGPDEVVDDMDECLVPYDFDWTRQSAVMDDDIFLYYSQLPYDSRFLMIFDCCHSGGIHRNGGPKVRGIDPPDDIRHRAMEWNPADQTWRVRDLADITRGFVANAGGKKEAEEVEKKYAGEDGNVRRLGRAMAMRPHSGRTYAELKRKVRGPVGPYLPIILEACQESEYAYEYRHGATSYGAFTFTMARILRKKPGISFTQLIKETGDWLRKEGYKQQPALLGPSAMLSAPVPHASNKPAKAKVKSKAKTKAKSKAKSKSTRKKVAPSKSRTKTKKKAPRRKK